MSGQINPKEPYVFFTKKMCLRMRDEGFAEFSDENLKLAEALGQPLCRVVHPYTGPFNLMIDRKFDIELCRRRDRE